MKSIFYILSLLTLLSACVNSGQYYDEESCADFYCDEVEPYSAYLYISYTKNSQNPDPLIVLMHGTFEDNNILDTLENENTYFEHEVLTNNRYTVVAQYFEGNDTILAIDEGYVEKESYYECGYLCWKVKNATINVKLK